ncbi:MAG: endolytic transglycosylase MltG [Xenococcaceae cyanobacterium]
MRSVNSKTKSPWLPLLTIVLAAGGLGLGGVWFWWQGATAPALVQKQNANEKDKQIKFVVSSGSSGYQIGQKLATEGLIRSFDAWKLWTIWQQKKDSSGGFKSGTYLISANDSLPAIASKIWRGEVMQASFTIPEGWSIKQMAEYFQSLDFFSADEFIKATKQIPKQKYPWLPDNLTTLEGYLYPDTYKISSDRLSNPQEIVNVMLDRFAKVALPVYDRAKSQTKFSLSEWVTLASIVEKEAVVPPERQIISGVFQKRLSVGMALQSDPTVEYGLGIKQTKDQPLTFKQVATPSPYNTYINPGLTPTPIASPGLASLEATLNPEKTDYLYFVARYDGTHVFSKTLAEHQAATKKIQQK